MFSPDASIHASISSQRNPRRRQRTHSDDSVATRRPTKRPRKPLAEDTFEPFPDEKTNGHTQELPAVNGHALPGRSTRDASSETTSLAYRPGKKQDREKRGGKGDGTVTLTKNDNYIVAQLPALPDHIRANKAERMRSIISAKTGHAVALTQTRAVIWPYVASNSSPDPSKTYTFTLPHPTKNSSDALPLGALVSSSGSSEPGLVVVMPIIGRITYWEDISTAATEDLMKQKQHGFQGTTGSMLFGETVTQITSAEPAGFVLTFSTGRIAHLSVRDPQGKPAVSVRMLRSNGGNPTGTLLGGLKNVFGGGAWNSDVAAVRAGSSRSRGQRDVIVATSRAVLQLWDLNWSGNDSFRYEIDIENDLLAALKDGGAAFADQSEHAFEILDFAVATTNENSKEIATVSGDRGVRLLVLTALAGKGLTKYALVEMTMTKGSVIVDVVHPITYYTTPISPSQQWKPRVCLPDPSQTAFVVFETAVVLVSLVRIEDSPDSQLLMDSHKLPQPFQDVIDFRRDGGYEVIGCGAENQGGTNKHPSCALMIRSFGIVRVAAFPAKEGTDALDRAKISAKTKIEQAVFYGTMSQNLIDFAGRSEIRFAHEEVEAAALEISDQILMSTSDFIPAITPSLDHQLKLRSAALKDLIRHLNKNYPILSRLTKWKLMWNAEKMAAARAVWKNYDASLKTKGKDKSSLLSDLVEMLHERFKTETIPELGEADPVRHWFIKDIWRIEYVVPWAYNAVQELYKEGTKDHPTLLRLISEANDISLGALETAFKFRQENASLYGLEGELILDGILKSGYEGLPEIWTSTKPTVFTTKLLVNFAREMAFKYLDQPPAEGEPEPSVVKKVAEENARQVQVCCQVCVERYRWCKAQDDDQKRAEGEQLKHAHFAMRKAQFTKLADIGLAEKGIALAEKYQDMKALVDLIVQAAGKTGAQLQRAGLSEEEEEALEQWMDVIQQRMGSYFHKFGDQWARALYTKHIAEGRLANLLDDGVDYQDFLTRFLRSDPAYAKISWINEVVSERNYEEAACTLVNQAENQETILWSKKIELSLAKLAGMAASEKAGVVDKKERNKHEQIDDQLALMNIQEQIYSHVEPTIRAAIDEKAEVELVMAEFGKQAVEGKPALRQVLEHGFIKLVNRQVLSTEEIIEVLTLMDEVSYSNEQFGGQEFFLAARALKLSGLAKHEPELGTLLERILWRRCMIRDDWEYINKTELKDDTEVEIETGATALFKTFKEGYKIGIVRPCNPISSISIADRRSGFWEGADAVQPPTPDDVLGAGCTTEDLRDRYPEGAEDHREPVARDMTTEDDLLQYYIDKGRLDQWFPGVMAAAKQSVRNDADAAGEAAKKRKEMDKMIEEGFKEQDRQFRKPAQVNGISDGEGDFGMDL
ncbi:MAG: hypothetical protein M1830_002605 [Pleopsidium flavum]|nr:MAG: hypothetical protein M1830_002605 [Pleopsidium flavum]